MKLSELIAENRALCKKAATAATAATESRGKNKINNNNNNLSLSSLSTDSERRVATAATGHPNEAARVNLGGLPAATKDILPPRGHCKTCRSGFWQLPAYGTEWVCRRCQPVSQPVASILNPGGSVPLQTFPLPSTEPTRIEPAVQPDGSPPLAIYWESGDGRILGPAMPEFLARSGGQFWIVTTLEGQARWINADHLRSKRAFETQQPMGEVDRDLLKA